MLTQFPATRQLELPHEGTIRYAAIFEVVHQLSLENGFERAPTIYDVAKHAGVSHQTVSRLLKGQTISPAFKVRVDRALADLNYRPDLAARSLATRQSNRIATLIYEMGELGPI